MPTTPAATRTIGDKGDACSSAGWCSLDVDSRLTFNDLGRSKSGAIVAIASRDGRSQVVTYDSSSSVAHHLRSSVRAHLGLGKQARTSGSPAPSPATSRMAIGTAQVGPEYADDPCPNAGELRMVAGRRRRFTRSRTRGFQHLASETADWTVDFGGDAPDPELTLGAVTGTNAMLLRQGDRYGSPARCASSLCACRGRKRAVGTWEALAGAHAGSEHAPGRQCATPSQQRAPVFMGLAGIAMATARARGRQPFVGQDRSHFSNT